jgi:hypothetical protein
MRAFPGGVQDVDSDAVRPRPFLLEIGMNSGLNKRRHEIKLIVTDRQA